MEEEGRHDDIFAADKLVATKNKVVRKMSDLSSLELSQLTFLVESARTKLLAFGNPGEILSVEDCFNKRKVDDGIVFYKEMRMIGSAGGRDDDNALHYWLGYFGGNPTGYLLFKGKELDGAHGDNSSTTPNPSYDEPAWTAVVENCDGDFIWLGSRPLPSPKTFIKAVKRAAYGDKYDEEDG